MEYKTIRIYGNEGQSIDMDVRLVLQYVSTSEENKRRWGFYVTEEIINVF